MDQSNQSSPQNKSQQICDCKICPQHIEQNHSNYSDCQCCQRQFNQYQCQCQCYHGYRGRCLPQNCACIKFDQLLNQECQCFEGESCHCRDIKIVGQNFKNSLKYIFIDRKIKDFVQKCQKSIQQIEKSPTFDKIQSYFLMIENSDYQIQQTENILKAVKVIGSDFIVNCWPQTQINKITEQLLGLKYVDLNLKLINGSTICQQLFYIYKANYRIQLYFNQDSIILDTLNYQTILILYKIIRKMSTSNRQKHKQYIISQLLKFNSKSFQSDKIQLLQLFRQILIWRCNEQLRIRSYSFLIEFLPLMLKIILHSDCRQNNEQMLDSFADRHAWHTQIKYQILQILNKYITRRRLRKQFCRMLNPFVYQIVSQLQLPLQYKTKDCLLDLVRLLLVKIKYGVETENYIHLLKFKLLHQLISFIQPKQKMEENKENQKIKEKQQIVSIKYQQKDTFTENKMNIKITTLWFLTLQISYKNNIYNINNLKILLNYLGDLLQSENVKEVWSGLLFFKYLQSNAIDIGQFIITSKTLIQQKIIPFIRHHSTTIKLAVFDWLIKFNQLKMMINQSSFEFLIQTCCLYFAPQYQISVDVKFRSGKLLLKLMKQQTIHFNDEQMKGRIILNWIQLQQLQVNPNKILAELDQIFLMYDLNVEYYQKIVQAIIKLYNKINDQSALNNQHCIDESEICFNFITFIVQRNIQTLTNIQKITNSVLKQILNKNQITKDEWMFIKLIASKFKINNSQMEIFINAIIYTLCKRQFQKQLKAFINHLPFNQKQKQNITAFRINKILKHSSQKSLFMFTQLFQIYIQAQGHFTNADNFKNIRLITPFMFVIKNYKFDLQTLAELSLHLIQNKLLLQYQICAESFQLFFKRFLQQQIKQNLSVILFRIMSFYLNTPLQSKHLIKWKEAQKNFIILAGKTYVNLIHPKDAIKMMSGFLLAITNIKNIQQQKLRKYCITIILKLFCICMFADTSKNQQEMRIQNKDKAINLIENQSFTGTEQYKQTIKFMRNINYKSIEFSLIQLSQKQKNLLLKEIDKNKIKK